MNYALPYFASVALIRREVVRDAHRIERAYIVIPGAVIVRILRSGHESGERLLNVTIDRRRELTHDVRLLISEIEQRHLQTLILAVREVVVQRFLVERRLKGRFGRVDRFC